MLHKSVFGALLSRTSLAAGDGVIPEDFFVNAQTTTVPDSPSVAAFVLEIEKKQSKTSYDDLHMDIIDTERDLVFPHMECNLQIIVVCAVFNISFISPKSFCLQWDKKFNVMTNKKINKTTVRNTEI